MLDNKISPSHKVEKYTQIEIVFFTHAVIMHDEKN